MTVIGAGEPVPPFSLVGSEGGTFSETDLDGRTTVFVFYPYPFSPVCSDQLSLYQEVIDELSAEGAVVYGVSCDSRWSLRAFKEKLGLTFEQLSDFEPKGMACRAFGVLHPDGHPERALLIVGPDRCVRWSYQAASTAELPGANLIFDGLAAA